MTPDEKREKRNWFLLMLGYFTAGYLTLNWIASRGTSFLDVSFGFENDIPFIPVFILGYACAYAGMFVAYFVINDNDDWHRTIVGFFLATTTCYLFFIFLPVRMEMRPELYASNGMFVYITGFFYQLDMPQNCFPSLHVTYPVFATMILWRRHRTMRWVMGLMAAIIAISVILVKQHYIADVIAGFVVAILSYWITVKTEGIWKRWFPVTRDP